MASFWYEPAIAKLFAQNPAIDLDTDTIKVMLCNSTTVSAKTDTFVDDGSADDPASGEIVATNYTGGFNGAGRKTLANKAVSQPGSNQIRFDADDVVWTALGGAANDTVTQAIIIKEITNDAASILIVNLNFTGVPTNGGNFTVQFNASGIGYATV